MSDLVAEAPSLTQKSVSGSVWITTSTIFRQFLSLISIAILARLLPPKAYGLMSIAVLATNFLTTFRDLGFSTALVQRREISRELIDTVFAITVGMGALLGMVILVVANPVSRFFREPELVAVMRIVAVAFCFSGVEAVPRALLRREMAFRRLAFSEMVSASFQTVVAVSLAYRGLGVLSLAIGNVAYSVLSSGLIWWSSAWCPRLAKAWTQVRSITTFSLHYSGANMFNYWARNSDNIIIGRLLGSAPLGYYQIAYTLMLYPLTYITQTINQVTLPAFAKIQSEDERFREALCRVAALVALVTAPMMMGLVVIAEPFVRVVLGPQWEPSIRVIQILAPVGLVQSITCFLNVAYLARGEAGIYSRIVLLTSACYVGSFLIGVRWGLVGVALTYGIAVMLMLYPTIAVLFRMIRLPWRMFLKHVGPVLAASLLMAATAVGWMLALMLLSVKAELMRLITTVIVGCASYLLFLRYLRPPSLADIVTILPVGRLRLPSRVVTFLEWLGWKPDGQSISDPGKGST
jgi:O-antigen/teichoic acid export membrane protein